MRPLRVSDDIVPVSELKSRVSEWLRRVAESGEPLVITQNGKAAGVLLAPRSYDRLVERAHLVAAVEQGLGDSEAGRLRPHDEVVAEARRRIASRK